MLPVNPYLGNPQIKLVKSFVTFLSGMILRFFKIFELVSRYSIHPTAKFQVCSSFQFLNLLFTRDRDIIVILYMRSSTNTLYLVGILILK